MRRLLCSALLSVSLATVPAALALSAEASRLPLATAKLDQCSPESALAVFHGRMRSVPGTDRMSMRFTLLQRVAGGRFQALRAPALGRWRRSRSGVRVFGFKQRVLGLTSGAVYRARIDYRWFDRDGVVIRRARRRSAPCGELGELPNLRVVELGLGWQGGLPAGVRRYRVTVANAGRAPAANVDVTLSVDGTTANAGSIPQLAPSEVQALQLTGPTCPRPDAMVRVVVDPDGAIPESSERDNSLSEQCALLHR